MGATLGDPVLLATYGAPSRKGKGKEVASDERPLVFGSFASVPSRDDEEVTLSVQGDGVYVYELGDLHPISSRTFGPSTSFTSAPASVIVTEGETSIRRVYAPIYASQGLKKDDSGRVIWSWKESASGDLSTSKDKQSTQLSHDVLCLLASPELGSVIAVSGTGDVTRMDLDLNMKSTWSPRIGRQKVKKIFLFSARECTFLPQATSLNGCVLVMLTEHDKKLSVQIILLGREEQTPGLDPLEVSSGDIDDVVDASLEPSGNMTLLGSSGILTPYLLEPDGSSIAISAISPPLCLKSLNFITEKRHRSPSVSILSLGSSFVLLAGTASKEIALLLWDVQYGVLLHSTTLPIPATLDSPPNGVSIQLERGNGSQALLILSPISMTPKNNTQPRSSVLLVPFSVPKQSTIASVLGKADQGAKWLTSESSRQEGEDARRTEEMLGKIRGAIESGKIKEADEVFFSWVSEQDERLKQPDNDKDASQDVEMSEGPSKAKKPPPLKRILEHSLVTRILTALLRPGESPIKQHSAKICRYLVTKHLVSHSMVKGGILDALLQRNDWETIRECFSFVVDLPEGELLRLLHVIVKHHRNRPVEDNEAGPADKSRKIRARDDNWSEIPWVKQFLARVVDYPATQAAWRTGLRQHFADVEDLMCLLTISDEWVDAYSTKGLPIVLGEPAPNQHGVPIVDPESTKKPLRMKGVTLPSLENLLTFIQTILDSSFLNLLQNPASHPLLQRISENIAQIQALNLELQGLRGPVEPFARAQNRAIAEAANGGKKREEVDWRKRRKQAHEQAALSLGPYQVEELVF